MTGESTGSTTVGPPRWPLASSLTSRGWGLLATGPVLALAAHVFGIAELYPVAAAALVLVAYAVAWVRTRRWQIDVDRRLQPGRVEAGNRAPVLLTLHNRSRTSSPTLTLRDPFGHEGRTTDLTVAPLGPRQRVSASYRLPPAGRGVFTLGPLSLEVTDPFGLARRVRVSNVVSTFIVHPRVEHLRSPEVGAGADHNRGSALPIPGRDNDEFASLREYQLGDDVRRMHWASTARTDTLMMREDQLERRGQFSVVLDTRGDLWTAAAFERAVSAAASVAVAALDAGLQARIMTTGGDDSGSGHGQSRRGHILDVLAETRTHRERAGHEGGHPGRASGPVLLPAGGTVVIVSSDRADPNDLRRAAGVGRRTELIVVIIEQTASPELHRSAVRLSGGVGRVVRVAPGMALASAWERIA